MHELSASRFGLFKCKNWRFWHFLSTTIVLWKCTFWSIDAHAVKTCQKVPTLSYLGQSKKFRLTKPPNSNQWLKIYLLIYLAWSTPQRKTYRRNRYFLGSKLQIFRKIGYHMLVHELFCPIEQSQEDFSLYDLPSQFQIHTDLKISKILIISVL